MKQFSKILESVGLWVIANTDTTRFWNGTEMIELDVETEDFTSTWAHDNGVITYPTEGEAMEDVNELKLDAVAVPLID